MPNKTAPSQPLIVALAYEELCAFEFGIVAEVFGLKRPELGPNWYRFAVCSEAPGTLRTNAGLSVVTHHGLEIFEYAHTIIIPGWAEHATPPSEDLRNSLLTAHRNGVRIISICSGAFLLAAIGLLNGRRATTHWRYAVQLQSQYPDLTVDAKVLYIDHGDTLTSAGSAAGIDLLLHIVRHDYGPQIANSVARRMVLAAHRSGGQAQFIEHPVPHIINSPIAALLDHIRADLTQSWSATTMAALTAMSTRTFIRRFTEATNMSPGAWITEQRIHAAKELLEITAHSLEHIAHTTGIGSAANLRLHFKRHLGISPSLYRKQFTQQ
nr:transcriptional regulator FtrA [uncultured Neokomagataea sp.]